MASAALGMILPAGIATAATNAELEARIKQLETMLTDVKNELISQKQATADNTKRVEKAEQDSRSIYMGNTKVAIGGYIKADFMATRTSDGALGPGSAGRDFYIPGTIPVTGAPSEGFNTDFSGKETRLNVKTTTDLNGHKLVSFIEMDFHLSPGGNERVSNSYNPRMRHAFVKYDNWLFGQTWSTFQDVAALAENLDFVGPAESTVFERQPMIRYSRGGFDIALENPETTVTPFGGGARIVTDDGEMPDVIVRYTHKDDWGHVAGAAIVRQLTYDDNMGIDDTTLGWGVSLTGKIKVGKKDDIRFMAIGGEGLGRYLGLNTANGAVLDAAGNLNAIGSYAGNISYRHFWNDKWRSNLTLGAFWADNSTALTGLGVTKEVQSVHVNLLYSPVPKVTLGAEYLYARRELESTADGDMSRVQFSAKYGF
tara:strand:+ start:3635 stop:4915 length:1281 start_codon:yes stop_codon:yes gene_type:complete